MKKYYLFLISICFLSLISNAQTYCNPSYSGGSNQGYVPAGVWLQTMTHNPAIGSNFYADYTATYGTWIVPNQTYSMGINIGGGFNQYYAVYIDFNDDGDFLDTDENLFTSTSGAGGNFNFPFTVPNVSSNVMTRMRVITTDSWNTLAPCGSYSIGTTIDYYIFISPNNLCNLSITANCGANYITNVKISGTTLNNSSTCLNNGHSLFAPTGSATGILTTGSSYMITVNSTASSIVSCFIDYNHNFQFTDPLEWTQVSTSGTTGTAIITIPWEALTGPTFMRIRSRNVGSVNDDLSSCTLFSSGETEDYTIDIQNSGRFPCVGAGAVMTGCTGVFDDGSGPQYNYSFNQDCNWLIQPAGATSVTCSFYDVGISSGDIVVVYNGTSALAPALGIVSGTSNITYTASLGAMFVVFQSYGNPTNLGFTAHYTSNAPCGLPCTTNLQTNNCSLDYIYNVEVSTPGFITCDLSNYSWQCNGNAYTVYPPLNCHTTYMLPGDVCDLNLGYSTSNGSAVAAWVDLNQNNVFESTEQVIVNNSTTGSFETASFTVPASAVFGPMKLRTRLRTNGAIAATDACTSFSTGETEDYTLFVVSNNVSSGAAAPVAAFTSNVTNIAVGGSVNFTDLSSNSPASWNWTFTGAATTNSTVQNPTNIVYNTIGCYAVTLTATNAVGNNTASQTCYINVGSAPASCSELFFSEYLEGTSNNKALEIYNPMSTAINLSNYSIEVYANGAATPTNTQNLSGTLAAHDVYVLANAGAVAGILALADITSTACNFNGDDALVLKNSGNVIDVIGEVGVDPGTYFPVSTGSTLDYTLVRNSNVDGPSANWTTVQNQWTASPINTFTNLGLHTSNCINVSIADKTGDGKNKIKLYPNPTKGNFYIEFTDQQLTTNNQQLSIEVYDVLGNKVLQSLIRNSKSEISLESFRNGMYLVRVVDSNSNTFYSQRIVKE